MLVQLLGIICIRLLQFSGFTFLKHGVNYSINWFCQTCYEEVKDGEQQFLEVELEILHQCAGEFPGQVHFAE